VTTFGAAGVLLGPLLFSLARSAVDLYVGAERDAPVS
jgi:predicted PurR-regulated permease PerM